MFVEQMTSLNFMKRNNDIFEENDVLLSKRNSKTWNNACQDIQKFWGSIEFKGFMDKTIEAIVDGFSDHFSSWD